MTKHLRIGLVVPFATDRVPAEGPMMYPEVTFIPKGVGVRALTPEGYDQAFDAIAPAANDLAKQNVDAIMVIGTSLTFYRGYEAHQKLLEQLRAETRLPVSTMTEAVVDGLRSVGAKRVAVATAYSDLVNERLVDFLGRSEFEVLSMKGFGLTGFGDSANMSEQDIIDLSSKAIEEAKFADAVLISCGGLKTLGCAVPIEQRHGIPVVTSTQSAFWKAMRLAGDSGWVPGRGQLLGQASAAVS
ncbi:MAG: arylmalonate decarboxylase [Betaproteobacteria bacterium]|nr:MAG: arylmalonate decarboxylase [Betaproteobacteria bacterium]